MAEARIHIRRQVREALRDALANLATTGSRVFTSHPFPLEGPDEVPGLVVVVPGEELGVSAMRGRDADVKLDRTIQVVVVGYAEGPKVEDTIDAIGDEVETRIAETFPIGGAQAPIQQILLAGADIQIDGGAKVRSGEIRMRFEVLTRTLRSDPTTAV